VLIDQKRLGPAAANGIALIACDLLPDMGVIIPVRAGPPEIALDLLYRRIFRKRIIDTFRINPGSVVHVFVAASEDVLPGRDRWADIPSTDSYNRIDVQSLEHLLNASASQILHQLLSGLPGSPVVHRDAIRLLPEEHGEPSLTGCHGFFRHIGFSTIILLKNWLLQEASIFLWQSVA